MKTNEGAISVAQTHVGVRYFWQLIKPLQTGLLLVTGVTGYLSSRPFPFDGLEFFILTVSLFCAISGSTILNMVYDRDIDARMERTRWRPLVNGLITPSQAVRMGLVVSALGIGLATVYNVLYGAIVFLGWVLDVVVYTIWLKRRTPWSIVWGGLSGGMPILAGRVLGLGMVDFIGILLALAILLWIPTHILTFNMRFFADYHRAGIPTFPGRYGFRYTHILIALSAIGASGAFFLGCFALGLAWGYMNVILFFALGILTLAIMNIKKQSDQLNFLLFKCASLFMLVVMILISVGSKL